MLKPTADAPNKQPARNYEFSHDAGKASWALDAEHFSMVVEYPRPTKRIQDNIDGESLSIIGVQSGLSIDHHFYSHTVASRFRLNEMTDSIFIKITFSKSIDANVDDGVVTISNTDGMKLMAIVISDPMDDTGMSGPTPNVDASTSGGTLELAIYFDQDWLRDTSRVFPLTIMVDYSVTPAVGAQAAMVKSFALDDETILYHDTRPDAAVQFHLTAFDDSEFRRARLKYNGKQACSTVPLAIGDTIGLEQSDFDAYADGLGYNSRTVWLQFIASKDIPSSEQVIYDIHTPGTMDSIGNVAERVGSVAGLPEYRGSFVVHQQSPPGHQDGVGTIDVYIEESRVQDLKASISVYGTRVNNIPCAITVTDGARGLQKIGGTLTVIRNAADLPARLTVADGTRGLQLLSATITVNQYQPENELIYDKGFDEEGTWTTYWAQTPYDAAERVSGGYPSICHSEPYAIAQSEDAETYGISPSTEITIDDLGEATDYGLSFHVEPATIIRAGDVYSPAIQDYNSVLVSLTYKHDALAPPSGYEWYSEENNAMLKITAAFGGLGAGSDTYTESKLWVGNTYYSTMSDRNDIGYLSGPGGGNWRILQLHIDASNLAADDPNTAFLDSIGIYWVGRRSSLQELSYPYERVWGSLGLSSIITIDDVSVMLVNI